MLYLNSTNLPEADKIRVILFLESLKLVQIREIRVNFFNAFDL